ncbi:MAG TPA: response regulator, partial [Candidatus Binatia bacterium]|nr:response regulator [Candidatus Binatia bacterium]
MENPYDYKKFAVVYVDDEKMALKAFTLAFGDTFRIFTADNAQDGLKFLREQGDEIGILMTDQKMPGEKGVWLLEQARQLRPRILRILVTAYTDFEAAIEAVNSGAIYKYVSKPWDPVQLELNLRQGLEFFTVQLERDQLLREKMSVLRNMMIADRIVSLGLLAAGLSHHIRNSMVAVKTFLELAPVKMAEEKSSNEGLRDPDFWKEYHQNVQSQIEKINGLLADLRTASDTKPGTAFADEIKLQPAMANILAGLQPAFAARKIAVDNQIPAELPGIKVDLPKFNRLFELLFKDELAMLPAGSRIRIEAEEATTGSRPEVAIRITDDGPALPQDALRVV